jgi:hypothetical protein
MSASNKPLLDRLNAIAMSGDEFEDLVKAIQERDRPPKPQYSRKTKQINLRDPQSRALLHKVPLGELDNEIERFTQISDGTGRSQWLLDGLLEARMRYGHMIDGKNRVRGIQTKREQIRFKLQYASAWTYCFIQEQWKHSRERRCVPAFDSAFNRVFGQLDWHIIEREKADLLDPLADYNDFNFESFYLTYIHPRLHDVKDRITKSDKLAAFFRLENRSTHIPTPPVSFLRDVFLPFLR